ncbi:hypothetical protein GV794_23830 [Nocardia cyriacigeorgica]|uniref:Uncharacterized protein n=1 Tax=Nocardia cyriacigeorgica TaxID=135487 RepID=A0A6P1D7F4_9NOCA|nr:hypothetical protein [Nocardia cyriacigeorgica]NEW39792.1 hypothetical protein [Nocardia cyriacigeorgica]NEW45519.1 hypothetical protein [Nocardia cyriacigeorgica]NEW58651.1 hypothetical protein [Nocardia cyriacigeorgica]
MLWLPGRTVSTECAVAAIRTAEALDSRPGIGDPRWARMHSNVSLLGYTAREFASLLDIDWPIPDSPPKRVRRTGFWSARG